MEIELISFGKVSEFINIKKMNVEGIGNTDDLKNHLEKIFPQLAAMKYKLALNKTLVQEKSDLKFGDIVAIMPPFSGG